MDIEWLKNICLSLPATTMDVKWENDLVFSVGGKMYTVISLEPPFRCSFKVSKETFEDLSYRAGFMPAPYLARASWVSVTSPQNMSGQEWENRIRESYELVKANLTKKSRLELGLDSGK